MNKDIIKEFIISLLIVVALVLILSIFLYGKLSFTKVVPEAEEYTLPEEINEMIKESQTAQTEEDITTYYIDSSELNYYEKTKEYNKGKKNPFAPEETSSANVTSDITSNKTTNTSSSDNNSTNFYDDDGTK